MLQKLLPPAFVALSTLACTTSSFADGPAPSSAAAGSDDFRYQTALTAPTRLEIHDQNGPIMVEPASGDTLEVLAIKTGRKENFARVQVMTREDNGVIVVCALWPGQEPASCRPGSAPSGSTGDDLHVSVELRLRVPTKVALLDAHTMNGRIVARSPGGELRLHTMNGAIDATANGPLTAETMNGAVTGRAPAGHAVQLRTRNGAVEAVLPPACNADVEASTRNGRVSSEFGPVPASAIPNLQDVKLRVGSGGTPVSLQTMNGNVTVRRGG